MAQLTLDDKDQAEEKMREAFHHNASGPGLKPSYQFCSRCGVLTSAIKCPTCKKYFCVVFFGLQKCQLHSGCIINHQIEIDFKAGTYIDNQVGCK